MTVVIDPGHGGKDPGAVNKSIREKDVVLGVGLKLGKYINENFPDVKVIYTRSTDVFVPLIDRSRIANKNKADLFVSIHANYCATPSTRGTETFVLGLHRSNENLEVAKKENSVILLEDNYTSTYEGFDPNSSESYIMFELVQDIFMDQSLSFANDLQHQFKSKLETSNRGVKQAGFLVLRQSSMPSVLVETGFLSNLAEANYLKSDEGQQNIALSILEAFRKFKSRNSGSGSPVLADAGAALKSQQNTGSKKSNGIVGNQVSELPKDSTPAEQAAVRANLSPEKVEKKPEEKAENATPENQPVNVKPAAATEKPNEEITNTETATAGSSSENSTYFSVQIGASTTSVEPVAANFKGLKNIRREKTDKYYRYYVGKENSLEKILPLLQQIRLKFAQAFIVSFVDGKRVIVDTGSK